MLEAQATVAQRWIRPTYVGTDNPHQEALPPFSHLSFVLSLFKIFDPLPPAPDTCPFWVLAHTIPTPGCGVTSPPQAPIRGHAFASYFTKKDVDPSSPFLLPLSKAHPSVG